MNPVLRVVLTGLAALAVAALVVTGLERVVERQQTAAEINQLREDLFRARMGSERCTSSLASSEASLQGLSVRIDSLRSRVDSFEALDARGVPAGQYNEYMALFESYNDSVAVWEAREGRLRTAETSCRATIEEHNALTDSLQRVLANAGIEAG